ncbi:SH3 domain-containing protein [Polaribacter vadi]|uniref:SH3 domain-containing protein n=1 Tax=Polaribacter vadi TaxID=1774273 RepID=UPI0030EC856D|tara:strand:- start:81098 stop:82324 length:1227 start_codon:yes stop_codon:yes gene_type:complete
MKTENNQKVKYESLSKGLGITGLVLGIVTLLVSFIPCFGLFAVFFGIIAIMISLIGLVIALKHDHEKSLIIGAIICSLLGCGIAYSQYAAMNAITDEIVKDTNTLFDESDIKTVNDKKENQEKVKTDSKKKDIALVLEYFNKSKQDVTDENGLPLNYEYKVNWDEIKNIGKTEVYSNKGDYRNAMYLNLYVSEIDWVLSLNGNHTKTVTLVSHVYELNELNPLGSNPIPTEFTKKEFIYTPAIDNIKVQKEIIKKVTEPKFYQSLLKKSENDKKISNDWINATSGLIKSSNILNIKTIEDFEKVKATSKNEKKKVDNTKNIEVTIKEKTNSKELLITVDNLRVRISPDLDSDKIENLPLNTVVEFLDKKSNNKTKVTIKGNEIDEYWYQIKTPSGNIGWIHGCCFGEK